MHHRARARYATVRRIVVACVAVGGLVATPANAQSLPRPERAWESIATAHFDIHFPREMRNWAEPVAQRMESVAAAVNALVGNAPAARVTVVVEDPSNVANGFALPFLEGPVVFFWPTPPSPGLTFGDNRGWGEMLAVHEYGHIAHLTIPTRNPFESFVWRFLPTRIGPVARRSPAWVVEGYATWIEGRLTGSGRPASAGRAAVLRTWALDGKLPTYEQVNNTGPFLSGSMRYLVGSAFIEWLVEQKGDSSLPQLWRRMSARQGRSFGEAFRGVFGAYPDELYGRFAVHVMAQSLDVARQLGNLGIHAGDLVQHYRWAVGGPAVSRDGKLVALSIGARGKPSRIEVWQADPAPDSAVAHRRALLLARDSLDVPAIDSFPPARHPIATLRATLGRSPESPRFFADGKRLLVVRDVPTGDGAVRPDLFVWNYATGRMSRITSGAAIRSADPSPDGRSAVGIQCLNGVCSVVVVDVSNGAVRTLVSGSPDVVWNRPRVSPDGRSVAASVQREGRWAIAIISMDSGTVHPIAPADGADRHSPVFTPDGRGLIVISERGGIPNIELLSVDGGAPRTLTRLTGAALAPEVSPADGRVYFLTVHARGYDLRRLSIDPVSDYAPAVLDARHAPVVPPAAEDRPTFASGSVNGPFAYGVGPRRWRILPGVIADADGATATLNATNTDPIGRLGVVAVGGIGTERAWRGASMAATFRGLDVHLSGSAWSTQRLASSNAAWLDSADSVDAASTGAGVAVSYARDNAYWGIRLSAGGAASRIDGGRPDGAKRQLVLGDVAVRLTRALGTTTLNLTAAQSLGGGRTAGSAWTSGMTQATATWMLPGVSVRIGGLSGHVTPPAAPTDGRSFERFLVGGSSSPFADAPYATSQIPLPGVPIGYASGQRVALIRATLAGQVVEPTMTWLSAGDVRSAWTRIASIERELSVPSLGYASLPAVRARAGLSYALDVPYEHRVRAFLSVLYRP
ncbi:MAG: Protein TolB [Gemmatimonadaceae bacterium]|nr:Protein TolB [Gemmatimonadaceae bacterium]